ncbi:MAG: enoyl-CoA hydratase/isomerase family protein [Polyangiales bacterium]
MSEEVQVERRERAVVITLRRTRALNALSLSMIREIRAAMELPGELVIIRGEGKAFCSGGDVRAVREALRAEGPSAALARDFFAEEYRLNLAIARSTRPWVAIVDGIAMGGGLGISVHGSHRVVTERAVLAMPETAIGMVPDVGGTHFLSRLGETGRWLALTGARIDAAQAIELGLATHFTSRVAELESALCERGVAAIGEYAEKAPDPRWAERVIDLSKKSPTSVAITERLLLEARDRDLEACLRAEYRAVRAITRSHDFDEGIRAVLVDKTNDARFLLAPDVVERAFQPPEEGDWRPVT